MNKIEYDYKYANLLVNRCLVNDGVKPLVVVYDENASCHLALGYAYPDSIVNGLQMTNEELLRSGLNVSNTHLDFMVGRSDLKITADTIKGKKLIYSNGKFCV